MTNSPDTTAQRSRPKRHGVSLTTASVISFSLTMLAASIAVLAGIVPLHGLSRLQRIDIGELLFLVPVVALVLGVVVEAVGVALTRAELPEPRQQLPVRWVPGRRDR